MGYPCQFHEGQATGTLLLTNLRNGTTASSCEDCAPVMYAGALAATLGLPLDGLWSTIERYTKRAHKAAPADAGQAEGGIQDIIEATCPYCGDKVTAPADGLAKAKDDHLAACPKMPQVAETGGA